MKARFIREVRIDWSKMNEESYLRQIDSLKDVNTVAFNQNITFFVTWEKWCSLAGCIHP